MMVSSYEKFHILILKMYRGLVKRFLVVSSSTNEAISFFGLAGWDLRLYCFATGPISTASCYRRVERCGAVARATREYNIGGQR